MTQMNKMNYVWSWLQGAYLVLNGIQNTYEHVYSQLGHKAELIVSFSVFNLGALKLRNTRTGKLPLQTFA